MKKYLYGPLVQQMEAAKITAKTLAKNLGVDVRAIHRLIDGKTRKLPGAKMQVLSKSLSISRSELCTLLARQRDAVRLIRLGREIAAVVATIRWWRAPTRPDSAEWAPSRERIEHLVAGLLKLSDENFGVPRRKKLKPLRKLNCTTSSKSQKSKVPRLASLKPGKKLKPLRRPVRTSIADQSVSQLP